MRSAMWIVLSVAIGPNLLSAQERQVGIDARTMTVTARKIEPPLMKYRLLPAEYELRDGNAAPILLRLPWDEQAFMNQDVPKFFDTLRIPIENVAQIQAAGPGLPAKMYDEMRRAAYRRTADWEYPFGEKPDIDIMLPDVQGSRDFTRGLMVRIRFQIANGDLDAAREGILVGLANARHYARTPFLVVQMVAHAQTTLLFDRVCELLQQPQAPNLYWALTAVPTPFVNIRQGADFERAIIERSVAGAEDLERPRTPEEWSALADRLVGFAAERFLDAKTERPPEDVAAKLRLMTAWARNELRKGDAVFAGRVAGMSDGEVTVRWFLAQCRELSDRNLAAYHLSSPEAIERLRANAAIAQRFEEQWGVPLPVLGAGAVNLHLATNRFARRLAALRILEAIRDHAATHDGGLPEGLDQVTDTPIPRDPFTEQTFGYERSSDGRSFRLTAPTTKGQDGKTDAQNFGIDWRITVKAP